MTDDHPRFIDPNVAHVQAQSTSSAEVAADLEDAGHRVATGSVPAIEPGRHLSTQTEYPWRTAILHGGSTTIASLVAVASILGDERVQNFINTYVPGQAAGVIGFGIFCGLLAGTLSRIANLPAVAALRTKIGLGPIAKKNLPK
jgi:hypothetical protein